MNEQAAIAELHRATLAYEAAEAAVKHAQSAAEAARGEMMRALRAITNAQEAYFVE